MSEVIQSILELWVHLFENLKYVSADTASGLFLWLMFILFIFSLFHIVLRLSYFKRLVEATPGLLTALGILGTFVGIAIGLATFDPNNLEESVARLLEGLKLAFATSIAGLGGSTCLKLARTIIISIFEEEREISVGDKTFFVPTSGIRVDSDNFFLFLAVNVLIAVQEAVEENNKELRNIVSELKRASPMAQRR